jgi:hypothetical protein
LNARALARAWRLQADALEAQAAALREAADAIEADAPTGVETFSSVNLPPRSSRRAFAERCRSGKVQGARRVGIGRGATWTCSAAAWWASSGTVVQAPRLRLVESDERSNEAIAIAAIRSGGRRSIGGGK